MEDVAQWVWRSSTSKSRVPKERGRQSDELVLNSSVYWKRQKGKGKDEYCKGLQKSKDFKQNPKKFFNMCSPQEKKKKKDKILEFIWHGEVILKFYSYPDIYLRCISGSDTEHAAGKLAICLKHYLGKRFADLPRSTWRTGISLKWLLNAAVLNIYLVHTFCILDWIRWVKISPDESS